MMPAVNAAQFNLAEKRKKYMYIYATASRDAFILHSI
jgi:hypothetical protein